MCISHSGIRINILKAMTVMNWLDLLDDDLWYDPGKQPEHGRNALGERIPTAGNVSELTKALEEEKRIGLESEAAELALDKQTEAAPDEQPKPTELNDHAINAESPDQDQKILAQDDPQETRVPFAGAEASDQEIIIEEVFSSDAGPVPDLT